MNRDKILLKDQNNNLKNIINEIERMKNEIKTIKLEMNKKEDDMKNIINEKDNTIKELSNKLKEENANIKNEIYLLKEYNQSNNNQIIEIKNQLNVLLFQKVNYDYNNYNNFSNFNNFNNYSNYNNFNNFNNYFENLNKKENINYNDFIYPIIKEEQEKEDTNNFVSVIVKSDKKGNEINLQFLAEDIISSIIEKYKLKIGCDDEFVLTLNQEILTDDLTLKEANITSGSKLIAYIPGNVPKNYITTKLKHKEKQLKIEKRKEKKNEVKITHYNPPENQYNGKSININFKGSNILLTISTPIDAKASDLIKKFFTLTKYDENSTKFIYNCNLIYIDERKTISELRIQDGGIIEIIDTNSIIGA